MEKGTAIPAMDGLGLSARQQTRLWNHVRKIENFWTTLLEVEPGIVARIASAAGKRRWEVIFLTTRSSTTGELAQVQTQRWLHALGFHSPSVYVVPSSRGKIAHALQLDVVVEGRPENCLEVATESKAKVILLWPGAPTGLPAGANHSGVRVVRTLTEALATLEQYDDLKAQPRVVRSLKKMLGRDAHW